MKRIVYIILAILALLSISACTKTEPEATPTITPTPEATPAITPTPEPTPTQTPDLGPVSYTTGLPFEGDYKPVMVIIENSPQARPQLGLQTADIVYEVPVEGSITRFVSIFSDNVPDEVFPVRSARVPFLYLQQEWDAVFMHYGGSGTSAAQKKEPFSYYGNALRENVKFDVDGWTGKWNDYYYRMTDKKAPHNVVGKPKLAQEMYNYQPEPIKWLFDSEVQYAGADGTQISLAMCSGKEGFVSYTYNQEKDVYLRIMQEKEFKSKETGEQISVKNVIVQYSSYVVSGGVKLWNIVGTGNADYYIGGKLVHGAWERKSVEDDTVYYDDKGAQIVLKPGNTWIHIHPSN